MYPQSMFLAKMRKNIKKFHLKIIIFTYMKYCSILHGHVCVMEALKDPVFNYDIALSVCNRKSKAKAKTIICVFEVSRSYLAFAPIIHSSTAVKLVKN